MIYPRLARPVRSWNWCHAGRAVSEGYRVERGRALRTELATGDRTSCEFRTTQDVVLWPLEVTEARYIVGTSAFATPGLRLDSRVRGALRLGLSATQGAALRDLALDSLTFYIYATPDLAGRIYEQILANCVGVLVKWPQAERGPVLLPARAVRAVGFEDSEAMLPVGHRSFQGYRLLQEYFALPDRHLFFSVEDSARRFAPRRQRWSSCCSSTEACRTRERLGSSVPPQLHPLVNLFRERSTGSRHPSETELRRAGPQQADGLRSLQHRPRARVRVGRRACRDPLPFYSTGHRTIAGDAAYYTIQRRPRLASQKQRRTARTNYWAANVSCRWSIPPRYHRGDPPARVDRAANRDLPIGPGLRQSRLGFSVEGGASQTVRCLAGRRRRAVARVQNTAQTIGQLSLNTCRSSTPREKGAEMLRHLLGLLDADDAMAHRQVDGVRRVSYRPVVRRIPAVDHHLRQDCSST
jgi:type VI secretion system protein ImpG